MQNASEFSSISEENFLLLLRDVLDEEFSRERTSNLPNELNEEIRRKTKEILRNTNPSSFKIRPEILPENLQEIYAKFVHDYRRDLQRFHVQRSSEFLAEQRLKNFDWNVRVRKQNVEKFNVMIDESF